MTIHSLTNIRPNLRVGVKPNVHLFDNWATSRTLLLTIEAGRWSMVDEQDFTAEAELLITYDVA
jgi:hypothetical protein